MARGISKGNGREREVEMVRETRGNGNKGKEVVRGRRGSGEGKG